MAVLAFVLVGAAWVGCGGGNATGGTNSGSSSSGGSTCGAGAKLCEGSCTVTNFDPANCGACGTACKTGEVCSGGQCGLTCGGGSMKCGTKCADTQLDPANCGMCGMACAAGQVCSQGQCGTACGGGTTKCGTTCADTQHDPANCGGCNQPCGPGQLCAAGTCVLDCVGGTTKCGGACVDTQNDPGNCGGCNQPCPMGQVCSQATCNTTCQGGTTLCGAKCVDEQVDPANCGMCGKACGATEVCTGGTCSSVCGGALTKCGNACVDVQKDAANCGMCGKTCPSGDTCQAGMCAPCDSSTTDCDGDGWTVAQGDCCDKPGPCGSQPELVNPGAIEVVGNGIDDNCNGLVDLFDTQDTIPCDANLPSNSTNALDYAKAIGICRQTTLNAPKPMKTWGLLDAQIQRTDGSPLADTRAISIRSGFGTSITPLNGSKLMVISSGIASDATQTNPGPNGGAPAGSNVSTSHTPASSVDIGSCTNATCISDWFKTPNPPLKNANELPVAPMCGSGSTGASTSNDSVMLVLSLRAPTNAKAFSFNSFFFSAEYPEFVCTNYNDQFIALVDTPNGTPKPIANPIDKNLMTFFQGGQKWPIGINIASGTSLFSVCETQAQNPGCWQSKVSALSCSLGKGGLLGTGFEAPTGNPCLIGGGTYWLTTAGNVIPGDTVQIRIAIWDVGDSVYDSLALIDGFQWLANATLPGTN